MKFSLGLWLAFCLAGLQFVAVTIVVSSSYVTSERVLLDHARDLLSDVGTNTIEHSKGFLSPASGAAELASRLAENKIVASDNWPLLEKLLFQQLQIAPQFAGVFYGDEDGNFVYVMRSEGPGPFRSKIVTQTDGQRDTMLTWRGSDFEVLESNSDPTDTYDPRTRPWYETAKVESASIWTDPYIFFTSQTPGITIASPVIGDGGTLQGVIGVDIEINAISDFLANLGIADNGAAVILNKNGDVIAHPRAELIKAENDDGTFRFVQIDEIEDAIARTAFSGLSEVGFAPIDQETFAEFTYEGEAYVSTIMPIISEVLPWTIAVYAPERDFIGAIKENRTNNVWLAVIIALVTGFIGLMLANSIYRPVRAFAVRSALVSQGEVDATSPLPRTYKELDHANETLMKEIVQRKNSEREYGLTFDLASRGMVQISPTTGRFLRANKQFADTLGYGADEILEKTTADLTHPDDPVFFQPGNDESTDDHAFNAEKRCVRKDGQSIWVQVNAVMIRDENGVPLHVVATVDDITNDKLAVSQIEKLNRDISQIARGKLLGQMAAGLAHELNQPLTAITQNVDAALLTAAERPGHDDELIQILKELDGQAHRAGDIIKALRGFARKDDELKVAFDFGQLLRQTLRLVQPDATENGIQIVVESEDLPNVVGIRIQTAQVLVNLLRNAIEAIANTGDNNKLITVTARSIDSYVQVCVEDSGPGVDQKLDLFAQFETTKIDGMGLGLSICRSMVESSGGKMWHEKCTDHGARFCFTLPSEKA
jgi:PAS domain S-box-containing protein